MISQPISEKVRKQRSDKLTDSYKVRTRRIFPFVGWDGEGFTTGGTHHYGLFGNSLGSSVRSASLDYRDCLPLLLQAPKNAIHVIYAGTYDVTMMFRGCPQIQSIMKGQWTTVDQYRLRFLRGKMLTVKDSYTGESRVLYDVFSFFGSSFVKACEEYLDSTERIVDSSQHAQASVSVGDLLTQVADMKLQRATFTSMSPEVVRYMGMELELLVRLCTVLRERLAAVDIHPNRWHGPGAVASTVLKTQGIKFHKGEQSADLTLAGEAAYYGGRFEMFKRGTFIGSVYQYDIRSAYPNAMSVLPSLEGVEWTHRTTGNIRVTDDFALYRVVQRHLEPEYTVPHRTQWGAIYYPDWANGWYWGVELKQGSKAVESWIPTLPVDAFARSPFSFVWEMYERRATLKRGGKPEQLALKLALNSLYGKLAQSKGSNWNGKMWQKPTYHQALWAGYITAHTRAMIQHAIGLAGDSIIAVETDAIFTTKPLPLNLGTKLGQWDETRYDGIKYIQSGVHMTLADGEWSYKTRGVTMKRGADDSSLWDMLLARGTVDINQVRFGTDPRQVEQFGKWYTQRRRLILDHPDSLEKRMAVAPCSQCKLPPDYKLTKKTSPKYTGSLALDYDTHLHPMMCPPIPMRASVPYSFVWAKPYDDTLDDPTLYLEYQPETLYEGTITT